MDFSWDETKRRENWKRHRVDFAYAARIFLRPHLTRIDDRENYGEERLISLGMVEGECFVVVHTERDGATRIISAWKASRIEREEYYTRFLGGFGG